MPGGDLEGASVGRHRRHNFTATIGLVVHAAGKHCIILSLHFVYTVQSRWFAYGDSAYSIKLL